MAKLSKRLQAFAAECRPSKLYPIDDASLVKECASAKFDESIDVAVQLGIDAKESDQGVVPRFGRAACWYRQVGSRGSVRARRKGSSRLAPPALKSSVRKTWLNRSGRGNLNFDVVIASPDTMRVVGTLGQILGPRGLMPNQKVGTVTAGRRDCGRRTPRLVRCSSVSTKAGIIHATIGRASFRRASLRSNLSALVEALQKAKPATSKGVYLRKIASVEHRWVSAFAWIRPTLAAQ